MTIHLVSGLRHQNIKPTTHIGTQGFAPQFCMGYPTLQTGRLDCVTPEKKDCESPLIWSDKGSTTRKYRLAIAVCWYIAAISGEFFAFDEKFGALLFYGIHKYLEQVLSIDCSQYTNEIACKSLSNRQSPGRF